MRNDFGFTNDRFDPAEAPLVRSQAPFLHVKPSRAAQWAPWLVALALFLAAVVRW